MRYIILLILSILFFSCSLVKKYPTDDRLWALPEIEAFEKLDEEVDYPDNAILFIGSSSIRLWKTLDIDMSPYPVIKRGYGGAHFRDIIFFTERILSDHDIKMVVCFVANDISGSTNDGSPREILRLFRYFIKQIRLKHPLIPIMQISITPTKSRWKHWHKINKVNHLIQAYCRKIENVYFINTVPEFLDKNGRPKSEWFVGDQLHLNKTGYKVWNKIIRTAIEGQLSMP